MSSDTHKNRLPVGHSIFWTVLRTFLTVVASLIVALSLVSYLFLSSFIQKQVLMQLTSLISTTEEELQRRIQASRVTTSEMASALSYAFDIDTLEPFDNTMSLDAFYENQKQKSRALTSMHIFDAQAGFVGGKGEMAQLPSPPPERTVLIPVIGGGGWEGYDIITPISNGNDKPRGWLVAQYATDSVLSELAHSASILGDTGVMVLGAVDNGDLLLLQHSTEADRTFAMNVGSVQSLLADKHPIAMATLGSEGIGKFTDHNGNDVFASFRYLPDLGWGLMVKVHEHEALAGAYDLTRTLVIVGMLFAAIAAVIVYSMSRQLTQPLIRLSKNVSALKPGKWNYERSVFSKDEIGRLDVVVADLTKRLRKVYENLEAEVQKRTERLKQEFTKDRTILQSLSLGLIVVDPEGNVQEANPAAMDMLKCKESDVIGVSVTELLRISERQKELAPEDNPINRCLEKQEHVKISPDTHLNIVRADDTSIAVQMSVSPLLQEKTLLGGIVLFRDVTTERQLDYMKSEFITLASHQLRTPLSAVQWYLELLTSDDDNLTEEQKEFIVELRLSTRRMSNIVGELMDASRIQKGGVEPVLKTVNLKKFVGNLTDELKSMAGEKGVTCHSDLPTKPVFVKTDPMLLSIVMQNLISNAIKYSEKGGKVRIVLTKTGSEVLIHVKDKGIGIPVADQEHLFQKLYRAHNARKLDVNGSGLGLYSSKNILEKLGGSIEFESKEGEGSTFTVIFPPSRVIRKSSKEEQEENDDTDA